MKKDTESASSPLDTASAWIGRLIEQGRPEYQAFEVLAGLDHEQPDALIIRRALCAIVDILLTEDLAQAEKVRATANLLIRHPLADAAVLFERWAACLTATQPHRKRMADVCTHFAKWHESLPRDLLEHAPGLMPGLLAAHGSAALDWLPILAAKLSNQPDADRCARLIDAASSYLVAVAPEEGLRTLDICATLIHGLPIDVWDAFCKACPAESVLHDGEASDFWAQLLSAFPDLADAVRLPFIRLMTELAGQSFSSAGYLAARLPNKLAKLQNAEQILYLELFHRLIVGAGIAANAYAFKLLFKKIAGNNHDAARRVVDITETIGLNYGKVAAIKFLDNQP